MLLSTKQKTDFILGVKFRLKNRKDSETLIYLVYYYINNEFVYSTGEKIKTSLWNPNSYRAVKRNGRGDLSQLNNLLDRHEEYLNAILRENKTSGKAITNSSLKYKMDIKTNRRQSISYKTLIEFGDEIVRRKKEAGVNYKAMHSSVGVLERFNNNLSFDDISIKFYDDFTSYMRTVKRDDGSQGYAKSYIAKTIGNIKLIMNTANEEQLTKNTAHRSAKFKRRKEKVYNIYLTIQELEKLHNHKFSKPHLDNACDLFLIGCFTGLRVSDYNSLKGVHFDQDDFITKDTQKVNSRLIIPKHWIVTELLEKRKGELPHSISDQKLNNYLKLIGKEAEINTPTVKTRTEGTIKVERTYIKWELMTTNTARRSLTTNMYLEGVPLISIARITGHSSIKQLMEYIKITDLEIRESLVDHPFFKKSP